MKKKIILGVLVTIILGATSVVWAEEQERYRVVDLHPTSSLIAPVVSTNDTQEIFITVRDQNLNPVSGAASMVTIQLPNGDQSILMPLTDENGVSKLKLSINNQTPGAIVSLEYRVVYGDLQATTRDSFRIWW
ncbi:MAG: hypothetical protein E3J37_00490 [Anaerolineales bacterium]|nr:MAG: hypothetical protein E3J37_00490 [Anaerolineales bacterium]